MATITESNHDSSTTLSDHWGTISDDTGLTVTTAAQLGSSTNGIQADVDNSAIFNILTTGLTPPATGIRHRFMFDSTNINNIPAPAHGASEFLFRVSIGSGGANGYLFEFELAWSGGGFVYSIRRFYANDGDSVQVTLISNASISVGFHCIDLRVVQETADGNNDGEIEILIDTIQVHEDLADENFNIFDDWNRLQLTGNSATQSEGITGDMYLDEFIITDDSTQDLGCVGVPFAGYDLVIGGGQS